MDPDRRRFVTTTLAAGGALSFGFGARVSPTSTNVLESVHRGQRPAPRALNILILGGTNMTGPHHVRYALERGHTVTIFTRGRTQPGLFAEAFEHVEHLIGDRENDLTALRGRQWDAVIDASGMNDAWTRDSAALLRDAVGTYLYISSTGVYYPYLTSNITENTPVEVEDPSNGEEVAYRYGTMKARSENEARAVFGDRTCIIRGGYIVGPLDRTHRGTYWPERVTRGGDILVPGRKTDQVQQIDVRDLTEWIIHLLENQVHGTFNVTGPASTLSMEEFVYGVRAISSAELTWTWIEDYDFLRENRVSYAIPWIMATGNNLGSQRMNIDRAKEAGLTFRPIATTARETLDWYNTLTEEERSQPPMALTAEREATVLEAWRSRS